MAGGGNAPTPSARGKRSVDFQLNMIPFIDLLSVLISFLLMTSVWTQIAGIDIQQAPSLPGTDPSPATEEEKLGLSVLIKASGYTVTVKGAVVKEIEKTGEVYDSRTLAEVLREHRVRHPHDVEVSVTSEDKVPYRELITVLDLCRRYALTGISVGGVDA